MMNIVDERACSQQKLDLSSVPQTGPCVVNAMFDLTTSCNLRCQYCFKHKNGEDMPLRVAQDAIIWLIYASGSEKNIGVQFMGGEPMLKKEIIKTVVPFGKERARSHGKSITFGITTNTTLVDEQFVKFASRFGIHFHLSLDGTPEVQDMERPLANGDKSSLFIERMAPQILAAQPTVMSRACVTPNSAAYLVQSFHYFRDLGFTTIGFFPCEVDKWTQNSLAEYERELFLLGEEYINALRHSINLTLQPLERWFAQKERDTRGSIPCGSGRGLVLIDTSGRIWPCSRFSSFSEDQWKLGSIYGKFSAENRKIFLNGCSEDLFRPECKECIAKKICEGGCLAENFAVTGQIFSMHPNDCEQNRILARVGKHVHDILYSEKNALFMKKFWPDELKEIEEKSLNETTTNESCAS